MKGVPWYEKWYQERKLKASYRYSAYPLWNDAVRWVMRHNADVTDLGCGYGNIGRLLEGQGFKHSYLGVDFAPTAIKAARTWPRTDGYTFMVRNILRHKVTTPLCVMCEVLEHMEGDDELLLGLSEGTNFWASVPSFESESHVRVYKSMTTVLSRYEGLVSHISAVRRKVISERVFYIFTGVR